MTSNWSGTLKELEGMENSFEILRKKYISKYKSLSKRNVVCYYSGWMYTNDNSNTVAINDDDINGLMSVFNNVDFDDGLDLILHTPGGEIAATEAIINYIRSKFKSFNVIVPHLAMSGGTLIALSSDQIVLGNQSSLGPIDPQIGGLPAHAILEEFKKAGEEILNDKTNAAKWQFILSKYHPTIVGEAEKSIKWSEEIAEKNLRTYMLKNKKDKIPGVLKKFGDHADNFNHSRHFNAEFCKKLGLNIKMLEDDQKAQDAILCIHHSFIISMQRNPVLKIIQGSNGSKYVINYNKSQT